jgi:hypothetical protein
VVHDVERAAGTGQVNESRYTLVTHLGLGDGIVQSGLAVALLARCEELAFPCYPQYAPTFRSIFANHPRVTVFPVEQIHGEGWGSPSDATFSAAMRSAGVDRWRQIRLGIYAGRGIAQDFTKTFYEQAQVDYSMKWRLCPIVDAFPLVAQFTPPHLSNGAKRIFLHDDQSRGFYIHRQYVAHGFAFSPQKDYSRSVLSYAQYIIECDEVHCIDSGFFWLADALPCTGRLFLHKYARWPRSPTFRYETFRFWNYVE